MALISFEHQFIFIKTTKTAGTSIEIDLSQRLEDDAIVTPIIPAVDQHLPRNYLSPKGEQIFWNHMSTQQIEQRLGSEAFSKMFKFCVEREPVDKCISYFHMFRNSPTHNPNNEFTQSWQEFCETGKFPVNLQNYTRARNGKPELMVDRVLRYDRLDTDLPELLDQLGIPDFKLTARAKSEYSKNEIIRKEDVTQPQREMIYKKFAATLEVTGIQWEV